MVSRTRFLAGVLTLLGALAATPAGATGLTPVAAAATTCDPANPNADLATSVTYPLSVGVGGTVVYAITVQNVGPCAAPNVTIDTVYGDGGAQMATWKSNTGVCATVSGGFPCNVGSLDPGGTVSFASTYTVNPIPTTIIQTYVNNEFLSTSDVSDLGSNCVTNNPDLGPYCAGDSGPLNTTISGISQGCSSAGAGGLAGLLAMLALGFTRRRRA